MPGSNTANAHVTFELWALAVERAVVVIVRLVVAVVDGINVCGEKLHVDCAGNPEHEKVTTEEKG